MRPRPAKLFVGMGNLLRRDDAVGVVAAQMMGALRLPQQVEVYDGGTQGVEVAAAIEGRRHVVVADAIDGGASPGTIFRFRPHDLLECTRQRLSLHDLHFMDAWNQTRLLGTSPDELVILAVEVADVSAGIGLSPPVLRALPRLLEIAVRELGLPRHILNQRNFDILLWRGWPTRSTPWQ